MVRQLLPDRSAGEGATRAGKRRKPIYLLALFFIGFFLGIILYDLIHDRDNGSNTDN